MHYHLEIIMPPTKDVEKAVESILTPFNENSEDANHAFFDWYVIGGRWAGNKAKAKYDQEKLNAFWNWLKEEGVTVSSFAAGKQTISPETQIPKVDAKWNEMFPSLDGVYRACPLFSHSNNQYAKGLLGTLSGDIDSLENCLEDTCFRVIFAGPSYVHEPEAGTSVWSGPLEAKYMLEKEEWNGVNYVDTAWDGKIGTALNSYLDKISTYKEEYIAIVKPQPNWLVVTVDYHS